MRRRRVLQTGSGALFGGITGHLDDWHDVTNHRGSAVHQNFPAAEGRADGGTWSQIAKLAATDGDSNDRFGTSLALTDDGTRALVGAWLDADPNGEAAGSAYVYERDGTEWEQVTKLAAADGDPDDRFGDSVALAPDGTTALIGASFDDDPNGPEAGSVYVFSRDGDDWQQEAKIAASDGDDRDHFGWSGALSNDGGTALIGTFDEDPNGDRAGAAYVFVRDAGNWLQEAKLAASDGDSDDLFSKSIALSGDGSTAIVGADGDDYPSGYQRGSAYVFVRNGEDWQQATKLVAADGDSNDEFGDTVAVSDDGRMVLVGAPGDEDPNGESAGSAYVFVRDDEDWQQAAKLAASDGDGFDRFGDSVALSSDGTTAVVGARNDEDPNSGQAGSAYVFDRDTDGWLERAKLVARDGDFRDRFGGSIALSGDGSTTLVGAQWDEHPNGEDAGSAYVFHEELVVPTETPDRTSTSETEREGNATETERRDDSTETNTDDGLPGFGVGVTLAGLAGLKVLRSGSSDEDH